MSASHHAWRSRVVLRTLILSLIGCTDQPLDRTGDALRTPFAVADSLRVLERYQPALAHYRRLRDSLGQIGDTAGVWKAELWWGYSQARLGNPDSAAQAVARAVALAGPVPERRAWTRVVTSNLLSLQGQFDSAVVEAEQARDLARGNPDLELQHAVSYALGWVYSRTGRVRDAFETDSASVARLEALGGQAPPHLLASALNALANDYYWMGRYSDAARYKEEALGIYRALGQHHGATRVLLSLAETYYRMSNTERALELYHEALGMAKQVGERTSEVAVLHNNLSLLFIDHGNLDAAQSHLEKTLEIGRATGQPYPQILALNNLGRVELLRKNPAAGRRLLKAALDLADSLGFVTHANSIRIDLVYADADVGNSREALRSADAALASAEAAQLPTLQVSALEARGIALQQSGRVSEATASYLEALDLIESWRMRVALGTQRLGLGQRYIYLYERTIGVLLDQNRSSQALGVAERARARLLLELMGDAGGSGHVASRSEELQEKLRDRLAERNAATGNQAALDREISTITAALTSLESEARRNDPTAGPARHPAPASVTDIRKLVRQNRSLLAFFWGQDHVYGWWVTRDTIRAARLGPTDSVAALIDFLGATINSPNPDSSWQAPARRAYETLITPLGPTDDTEILVIPDGPLAHTPLEVLLPRGAIEPWGVSRRIIYGPSASVLLALSRAQPAVPWKRTMLAVGNPSVGSGRVRDSLRAANDIAFGPLPFAEGEARAISDLFREEGADLLLGRRATIDKWMRLGPSDYRYLHFATHARVNDRRPDQTHLVLSQGVLTLPKIRSLRLRAELVTLSACETALGRRVRGEGIIGLPHAFLAAGARGVLVTLWRIGDQSAAEFMREFYQELHQGRPAAEALRIVRRSWMTGTGPSAHPSRWAPFVLVGGLEQ